MTKTSETNWGEALKPLIEKYKGKQHPLDYKNIYQLMVMVLLSAQDSDANINKVTKDFFKAFPDMKALSKASSVDMLKYLSGVRNHVTKISWLQEIASTIQDDRNIPKTMKDLTALKGIGRKSANVILREAGMNAEGIMVDLHVLRVVDRLGISHAKTGDKMEKDMMAAVPENMWGEVGMAISFLGREVCRPTNPKHSECVVSKYCEYCHEHNPSQCG
ncbi:MAG: endonuclease III [Flavobacterium sp.]|nr:MAG: endonuclease III [Flavobacterium sp.]